MCPFIIRNFPGNLQDRKTAIACLDRQKECRTMNILVLAHFQNDISPSCIFVHAQAKAYKRLGHTVTEISPVGWVPFLSFLRPGRKQFQKKAVGMQMHDGIPIYYPRYLSLGDFVSQKWNGYNLYRAAKKIVRRLLKTQKIDVIHAPVSYTHLFGI